MREGWDLVKLGSLCDIQNGFAFDSKLFNNDGKGLPLIRIRDIKRGYSETFTTEECDNAYVVKDGDYLIGMDGEFNIGQWKSENALLNQRVCKLLPSSRILPRFIYYYIPKALKDIEDKTAYATVKHLSSKQIKEIHIPNISLPEQQRIVDILDREFAKIDALKSNAEKSLQSAKDFFQATLKKELEPKEGWKIITLKDIAIVRVGPFGSSLHKNDYISGGTPLVNPIHMKDGQVVPAVDFSVNQEKLNELRSYVLKEGDVVFARRGEIGRCALITDKEDGYLCGTGSLFVRFLRKTNSKFMMALFNSPFVKEQLLSKATGATMLNINSTSVENLELNMPTDKEQESILSCIDDLNNRCITLQENYQKTLTLCDDLKQSLLRKAFNGEL